MPRVLLVDDQDMIREGLAAILSSHPEIEVVVQAATGESGVIAVATERPDVVLMDLRMPGAGGVEATRCIKAEFPTTCVLVLTTFDQTTSWRRAGRSGRVPVKGGGANGAHRRGPGHRGGPPGPVRLGRQCTRGHGGCRRVALPRVRSCPRHPDGPRARSSRGGGARRLR